MLMQECMRPLSARGKRPERIRFGLGARGVHLAL